MSARREEPGPALKRLFTNGPLTAWPARPDDQALLVRLAATRFEPGREYREPEVNEVLKGWLATFSAPFGIDHVTMRRELVDARWLTRDKSGALYRLDEARRGELEPVRDVEPAVILKEALEAREARKRDYKKAG